VAAAVTTDAVLTHAGTVPQSIPNHPLGMDVIRCGEPDVSADWTDGDPAVQEPQLIRTAAEHRWIFRRCYRNPDRPTPPGKREASKRIGSGGMGERIHRQRVLGCLDAELSETDYEDAFFDRLRPVQALNDVRLHETGVGLYLLERRSDGRRTIYRDLDTIPGSDCIGRECYGAQWRSPYGAAAFCVISTLQLVTSAIGIRSRAC
jgi:hypothetical protein